MPKIAELFTHPIKSTHGWKIPSAQVTAEGLAFDRSWVIVKADTNEMITGRKYPELLRLAPKVKGDELWIYEDEQLVFKMPLRLEKGDPHAFNFFSRMREGIVAPYYINEWMSNFLNFEVQMLNYGGTSKNLVLEKHGGEEDDVIGFADQCPILLINYATLTQLNKKLENRVTVRHFRPNIVISDKTPEIEETWKRIKVGECEFDVVQKCIRCVFTTLDPFSRTFDKKQEPLRTLATYKKDPRGGVDFGVHLIPRKLGKISVGNEVEVLI